MASGVKPPVSLPQRNDNGAASVEVGRALLQRLRCALGPRMDVEGGRGAEGGVDLGRLGRW